MLKTELLFVSFFVSIVKIVYFITFIINIIDTILFRSYIKHRLRVVKREPQTSKLKGLGGVLFNEIQPNTVLFT